MKTGILLSLIALTLFIWSCNGSKKVTDTPVETPVEDPMPKIDMAAGTGQLLAEMSKSACFGKCPVYMLRLFDNGRLEYQGLMNTDKLGLHSRQMAQDSFTQIVRAIISTDLWTMEDNYHSGATDFPITTITHHRDDTSKTVSGDFDRPKVLQALEKQLMAIADAGEWAQEELPVPYYAIKGEIIVELVEGFKAEALEQAFAEQGVTIKNRIAPNLNLWLYGFDEEKVNQGRIAVLLQAHEGVKYVDFNKKLESRN